MELNKIPSITIIYNSILENFTFNNVMQLNNDFWLNKLALNKSKKLFILIKNNKNVHTKKLFKSLVN